MEARYHGPQSTLHRAFAFREECALISDPEEAEKRCPLSSSAFQGTAPLAHLGLRPSQRQVRALGGILEGGNRK